MECETAEILGLLIGAGAFFFLLWILYKKT